MADITAFNILSAIDVNGHTEKKKTGSTELTYLSWPWAWAEVKKAFPTASYKVMKDGEGLPYVYDPRTGYMVYTSVTIEDVTHEMWLPVMDGANKAMKAQAYTYKVKDWKTRQSIEKEVAPATMFDINKTIMRCLVKNLAMFGLGLYIYAGEDLPLTEDDGRGKSPETPPAELEYVDLKTKVLGYMNRHFDKDKINTWLKFYKVKDVSELTALQYKDFIKRLEKNGGNINE